MYGNRQSRMERFCERALREASAGRKKIMWKVYRSEKKRLIKQLGLHVTEIGQEDKKLLPVVVSWEESYDLLLKQKEHNGGFLPQMPKDFSEKLALETLKAEGKNPY